MKILVVLITYLFSLHLFGEDEKLNACFITINSSEEKHLFKKYLSSGINAGKFEFHEFVPFGSENGSWFEDACKKNIRCDILLISGHFGGSFFGESGVDLSMSELETHSCRNDCKGLLSEPKEVFLLGCNTLAGKAEDNRSASEYLNVLLEDDIPMEEASRIVEQRYGAVGTSFADNMKRAFKGVPHIYGFHSIGPSGKSIERLLDNYHKKVPDYAQHLLEIEVKRGLALMNDFTQWNQTNDELAEALRITYFAQTSGVLIPCESLGSTHKDDPTYEILNNICKLRGDSLDNDQALDHIAELLLRDDFSIYLPVIADYLEGYDLKDQFKDLLASNPIIKDKIIELLEESKTGFGKLQIAKIAMNMDIISKEEFLELEKKAVLSYLATPVSIGSKDAVCSYESESKILLKKGDLDEEIFSDKNGLAAIQCLQIDDRDVVYSILDTAKNHHNSDMRKSALVALMTSKINDSKVKGFLEEKLKSGNSQDEKAIAFYVLGYIGESSQLLNDKLDSLLKSKRVVRALDQTMPEYELAFYSFNFFTFKDYNHLKSSYKEFQGHGVDVEGEEWVFSSGIFNLPVAEQIKFLEDDQYKNNLTIRGAFYDQFWEGEEDGQIVDKKMDIRFLPYLIEDIKKNSTDFVSVYKLGRIEVNTEEKQTQLINEIEKLKLSEEDLYQVFYQIARTKADNRLGPAYMRLALTLYNRNKENYSTSLYWFLDEISKSTKPISEQEKSLLLGLNTDDYHLKEMLKKLGITEDSIEEEE